MAPSPLTANIHVLSMSFLVSALHPDKTPSGTGYGFEATAGTRICDGIFPEGHTVGTEEIPQSDRRKGLTGSRRQPLTENVVVQLAFPRGFSVGLKTHGAQAHQEAANQGEAADFGRGAPGHTEAGFSSAQTSVPHRFLVRSNR